MKFKSFNFKWELKSKSFTPAFLDMFVEFLEKESSTRHCEILVIFYEVMKLASFEFEVGDFVPANVHNILPLFYPPLYMFFKMGVLKKLRNIHRKSLMLESFDN